MIITAKQALNLVSSHEIVKTIPELLNAVEAFASANRQWQPKKGCADCNKSSFFGSVEDKALQAIADLSPDAVDRLKKFIGRNDLYVNLPQPGKPAILKELK